MVDLAAASGLHINTVRKIVLGSSKPIMVESANIFANAFGLPNAEIIWPVAFTNDGRDPLSGGKYTLSRKEEFCSTHGLLLSYTGECDACAG
jgi:hypothetical protein